MQGYRTLTTICCAAVLALGLAACGGGGGDDTTDAPTTTPTPMPMPPPTAAVMIPDGMYLNEDNAPSAGMMTIAAGEMATNNGVIFSCPAGGDACEVEVMADGSVTSTGGEATAALSSDAMTQVAQAKQDAQEEADRAALENRDRIIGKDRALEAAANLGLTSTAGLDEDEIIITRGGSGPARVTSTGYSMSDDPALPNGNWAGSHLTDPVPGGMRHLFVYTDKEPATRIQFYNWDGDATTPSLYADTVTDALTGGQAADATTTITPLPLDGTAATLSARTADPTKFPQPQDPEEGSLRQAYANNADATGQQATGAAAVEVRIPGNYNGAGGQYQCTGGVAATPCSVTVAPNGSYTLVGTWFFIPELNSTAWLEDGGTAAGAGGGQIGEFMSFGWWLQEPTAQTGAYTFRYYADGTAYSLASGSNLATGSAVYNGRAAGKFVVQEIDDTGVVDGEAGMFTAAASLTARFTGGATGGAGGTLEGVINGFQSDNADVDVSGWSVTLARQTLTDTSGTSVTSAGTNNDSTAAGFDGATATLGDQTLHGTWASQFFGQPATADAYPLGVGGTFQADNEAASIAGAFGARR